MPKVKDKYIKFGKVYIQFKRLKWQKKIASQKKTSDTKGLENLSLQDSIHIFHAMFDKVHQTTFVLKELDFVYVNQQAESLFRESSKVLLTQTIAEYVSEPDRKLFNKCRNKSKPSVFEFNISPKGQSSSVVKIESVPLTIEQQVYTINYVINIDEAHLLIDKQQAEESDRLKSSFLANVSHEIRTPLNAIVGFAQLLSEDNVDSSSKQKYSRLVEINSQQLLNLIDDITDFVKIESGEISINKSNFKVNDLLKDIYQQFSESLQFLERGTDIELFLRLPDLPEQILINTDKHRLTQVIVNLLSNALKFTKKGHIELGYSLENERFVCFYVKDTGMGIQKAKQSVIFNRYQQIQGRQNIKNNGVGLGLAISKHIVDLLGGEISVESKFGKGSTFKFTIPYLTEQNIPSGFGSLKSVPAYLNWSSKTILLAEDEESNYLFINEVLKRTKVNLVWVENGKEAISYLKQNKKVDAILLDIRMPIMDGYQTISEIRAKKIKTPVIAQTAYAMVEDKDRIFAAGFDAYLAKPIQVNVLLNTLSRFIDG